MLLFNLALGIRKFWQLRQNQQFLKHVPGQNTVHFNLKHVPGQNTKHFNLKHVPGQNTVQNI